jgi:hypothetical protein
MPQCSAGLDLIEPGAGMKTSRIIGVTAAALTLTTAALVHNGKQQAKSRDELLMQQIEGQGEVIRQLARIAQELPQLEPAPVTKPSEPDVAWVRQESFWQGITTETLGALAAVGIIYLFGVAVGFVTDPNNWVLIASIIATALAAIGAVFSALSVRSQRQRLAKQRQLIEKLRATLQQRLAEQQHLAEQRQKG